MTHLDPWAYLARLAHVKRVRPPSDPFYADGDAVCQVRAGVKLTMDDDQLGLQPESYLALDTYTFLAKQTFSDVAERELEQHQVGEDLDGVSPAMAERGRNVRQNGNHKLAISSRAQSSPAKDVVTHRAKRESLIPRPVQPSMKTSAANRAASLSPKMKPASVVRRKKDSSAKKPRPQSVLVQPTSTPRKVSVAQSPNKLPKENSRKESQGRQKERRLSLAMITGEEAAIADPISPGVARAAAALAATPLDKIVKRRPSLPPLTCVTPSSKTSSRARISCDNSDRALFIQEEADDKRPPLSLARMGERLFSSSSSSSSTGGGHIGRRSTPCLADDESEQHRPENVSPSKSKIPVFKRSFSCKIPKQVSETIKYGRDHKKNIFTSDMFW